MKSSLLALGTFLLLTAGCTATPPARSAAIDHYVDACEAGDAAACANGASALSVPTSKYHDDALVLQLRTRACDAKPLHCAALGQMYFLGKGVPKDEKRGVVYLDKACGAEDTASCSAAAGAYDHGQGIEIDKVKAEALYEKACTGGVAADCSRAGGLLLGDIEKSEKTAKHDKTAKAEKSVKADKTNKTPGPDKKNDKTPSITSAGVTITGVTSTGITPDEKRSLEWSERGCALGSALGCTNAGFVLANAKSLPRDEARARTLFEKACNAGEEKACAALKPKAEPAAPVTPKASKKPR